MVLRIFKMIYTCGLLTALECTNFFYLGSVPDVTGGALKRSPDPLAGLRGFTSKGKREGRERGKGEKKGRGREREPAPFYKFLDPPL